ncbi:MAG: hypothetical protein ACRDQU_13735 [Pseudonocardiaceae bacterium]
MSTLVTPDEHGPEARYRLLEAVRQYATAQLSDAGEVDPLRERHLACHLALVEAAEPHVLGAGGDDPVLRSLAVELPNLRAALQWPAVSDPNAGLRLVTALALDRAVHRLHDSRGPECRHGGRRGAGRPPGPACPCLGDCFGTVGRPGERGRSRYVRLHRAHPGGEIEVIT